VLKSQFRSVKHSGAVIFEFLKSLPNLQSFQFSQNLPLIPPAHIPRLITSLQHAPLNELILFTGYHNTVDGPPTLGLSGLKKLAISWYLNDNLADSEAGSSIAYFYGLIQPSLSTLVELTLNYTPHDEYLGGDFDMKFLKPAGETLRVFEYTLQPDESILEVIPEIFPHLIKLSIKWENIPSGQSVLWKVRSQLRVLSVHAPDVGGSCRTRTRALSPKTLTSSSSLCLQTLRSLPKIPSQPMKITPGISGAISVDSKPRKMSPLLAAPSRSLTGPNYK